MSDPWSPEAWQEHANALLSIHHSLRGETYVRIPDKNRGDGGLEGFSSGGHAYQCYADQGSHSVTHRASKQKEKIDTDLPKLEHNQQYWKKMLQPVRLVEWSLLVPVFEDKGVQLHARVKGEELRSKKLPFLTPKFLARVCTEADFPQASQVMRDIGSTTLRLDVPNPTEEESLDYQSRETGLVNILDRKIAQLQSDGDPQERLESRREFVDWYLRRENMLSKLYAVAKPVWETVTSCVEVFERRTATFSRFDRTAPNKRFCDIVQQLEEDLKQVAKHLSPEDVQCIAMGTVALWLLRCPLSFHATPSVSHARPQEAP